MSSYKILYEPTIEVSPSLMKAGDYAIITQSAYNAKLVGKLLYRTHFLSFSIIGDCQPDGWVKPDSFDDNNLTKVKILPKGTKIELTL